MTPRQRRFISEYLIDHNASGAAVRSGFKGKRPDQAGYEWLRIPEIAQAIKDAETKLLASNELSASRILEEMRRVALSDIRGFFDDRGNLKPISALDAEQGACLASIEVLQRNLTTGDGKVDTLHKIKTWDKIRALEMLGKHFALLTEKVDLRGGLEVVWLGQRESS